MTDRVSQSLREVVAGRLIDSTVSRLRDDPAFNEALARAGLDEARLIDATHALEHAERLIGRLLRF